jgi:hypothetical protein
MVRAHVLGNLLSALCCGGSRVWAANVPGINNHVADFLRGFWVVGFFPDNLAQEIQNLCIVFLNLVVDFLAKPVETQGHAGAVTAATEGQEKSSPVRFTQVIPQVTSNNFDLLF